MPNQKPEPVADLAEKFAAVPAAIEDGKLVVVRWWKAVDDPALISLGGGIVTVSIGRPQMLTEAALLFAPDAHPVERDDTAGKLTKEFVRDRILDLHFLKAEDITGEELHRIARGEEKEA